ncbi:MULTISPECIES: right-handed parallel beta-helix repeat-containing protein [Haloferax]|uniref:right-handed parallel beta-helix repeat-containing protein n=1 Tax=Haloferax TaxID=2251 RepID=UPI00178293A8|nr:MULTISPECIES: right-handed parallel beta-helix repeat-containing protein [Haloferax]
MSSVSGLFLFGGAVGTAAASSSDNHTSDSQILESCTTIDESGSYVLTTQIRNQTDTCFEVRASDVVFDGNGHVVSGTLQQGTAAIVVRPPENGSEPIQNVTIRNVSLTNWVFGVVYTDVENSTLTDIRTYQTVDGISVVNSTNVTIDRVRTTNGYDGLNVIGSETVQIDDAEVTWLSLIGISVIDSDVVTVSNTVGSGVSVGIAVLGSTNLSLENTTITNLAGEEVIINNSDPSVDTSVETVRPQGAVGRSFTSCDCQIVLRCPVPFSEQEGDTKRSDE